MVDRCYILGIETSCDETSASVVLDGREILSNIISSQIDLHRKFGGVVPEIASRKHLEYVNPVVQSALDEARVGWKDISLIAVTKGPGLVGALLVGVSAAKAFAFGRGIPLIGVNHLEGHISANFLEHEPAFPCICLTVSGGHTDLIYLEDYGKYTVIGRTRDDAAGEAFDKVSRVMGLGYPGGPEIDRIAKEGDPEAVAFPRALMEEGNYDFSFSGLKSAVINYLHHQKQKNIPINKGDVAASFQQAVVDVLVYKTIEAAKKFSARNIILAGGVASNSVLREEMARGCAREKIALSYPSPVLCTDNAAMIACAGYHRYRFGKRDDLYLNAIPNLRLGE